MAKGWIKVERSILETDWYKDLATRVLWLHLQLTLGFTDTDELVTTLSTLSLFLQYLTNFLFAIKYNPRSINGYSFS